MPDLDPQEIVKLRKRVEELEAKMDFVYRRLGMPQAAEAPRPEPQKPSAPKAKPSPMVIALLHKGEKDAALKTYMKETGIGYEDAKRVIDALG